MNLLTVALSVYCNVYCYPICSLQHLLECTCTTRSQAHPQLLSLFLRKRDEGKAGKAGGEAIHI